MIKICKYMFLHKSIFHYLPFFDGNNTDSFMTIQFWTKTTKKLVRNHQKITKKKRSKKLKRQDIKNFWTIHFLTKTTQKCANFVHILLVIRFIIIFFIFQISIVQWLNCRNMKYELNCSHNGGGVVYLLKVRHLDQHDSIKKRKDVSKHKHGILRKNNSF